tara:strand:- start:7661 stop:8800 length:1140 start_codon:yes stop_codon:yes gene_type:complete
MLLNPSFIFIFIWSGALMLYSLRYSYVLLDLSGLAFKYFIFSILSVLSSWLLCALFFGKFFPEINKHKNLYVAVSKKTINTIRYISISVVILFVFEVLYFKGTPFLSIIGVGANIIYSEFGIPSLHGFISAMLLSLSMYSLYFYIKHKSKRYLFFYILTFLFPILSFSRGALVSLIIQSVFVFLMFSNISFGKFLRLFIFSIIFIILFGYLGEIRTSTSSDLYAPFLISDNYPDFMPNGFIWVYMYITTPLNNVGAVIEQYEAVNFNFYGIFYGFLPSFIRDNLALPQTVNLVSSAFNVSSFMPNYLFSFGYYGSLIFYFLASFFSVFLYYRYALTSKLSYGFCLIVLLHSTVLSIFSDFYFIQVYFFQFIIQFFVFRK